MGTLNGNGDGSKMMERVAESTALRFSSRTLMAICPAILAVATWLIVAKMASIDASKG